MKAKSDSSTQKENSSQSGGENILLAERSVYIDGVKVLQKQERISYFFSLIIALVLVVLLFVVLIMV